MASESLLERAAWSQRSADFGSVGYHAATGALVMEFKPAKHAETREWRRLREVWLELPGHANALAATEPGTDEWLLLRYAALDWHCPPLGAEASDQERATLVAWGAQIIDVFSNLATRAPKSARTDLLRPFVKIDVGAAVRIGFLPVVQSDTDIVMALPPEAVGARARVDERALVYVIGKLLRGLTVSLDGMAQQKVIVDRCLETMPSRRYRTVRDLQTEWTNAAIEKVVLEEEESPDSWWLAEEAVGWLALGNASEATLRFRQALEMNRESQLAADGLRHLDLPLSAFQPTWVAPPPIAQPQRGWGDVAEPGMRLEREHAFNEALSLYSDARLDGTNDGAIFTAIARCQLALNVAGVALDYARRSLAIDSRNVETLSIRTRAYLLDRKPEDALKCADIWIAAYSLDASARYARGRALFALARFEEARDAFDSASSLDPRMVEAMLLRREADQAMRRVRNTVGTQPEVDLNLPEHLSELRDAFAAGRIGDVLHVLDRPVHDSDPIAKLLQARCLAFEKRFEDAVAMFDRVVQLSTEHEHGAIIGKGYALLALDRAPEALGLFDRACTMAPTDLEAIEGRAAALRKLGRDAEADDELQRVVTASGGRSDLRVGRRAR